MLADAFVRVLQGEPALLPCMSQRLPLRLLLLGAACRTPPSCVLWHSLILFSTLTPLAAGKLLRVIWRVVCML